MSSEAAALLRQRVPQLDATLSAYLQGYLQDVTSVQTLEEDDGLELESFLRPTFEDFPELDEPDALVQEIKSMLMACSSNLNRDSKVRQLDHVRALARLCRSQCCLYEIERCF
jgi:hypothetical protein